MGFFLFVCTLSYLKVGRMERLQLDELSAEERGGSESDDIYADLEEEVGGGSQIRGGNDGCDLKKSEAVANSGSQGGVFDSPRRNRPIQSDIFLSPCPLIAVQEDGCDAQEERLDVQEDRLDVQEDKPDTHDGSSVSGEEGSDQKYDLPNSEGDDVDLYGDLHAFEKQLTADEVTRSS